VPEADAVLAGEVGSWSRSLGTITRPSESTYVGFGMRPSAIQPRTSSTSRPPERQRSPSSTKPLVTYATSSSENVGVDRLVTTTKRTVGALG
jgi:hypothetical protein